MTDTPPGDDRRDDRGDPPGHDAPGAEGRGADRHRGDDVDRRFAEIIAHWDDPATEPPAGAGGRGDASGVNPPPHVVRMPPRVEPTAPPATPPPATRPPAQPTPPPTDPGWRGYEVADEEEHFVPPPPRPLPAGDLSFWAIIVGLLGGPLLLLYLAFFDQGAGSLWVAAGLAMTVGGFGLLVARQPRRRDEDDDDTGAQV